MSTVGFVPDGIDGRKITEAEADRLHYLKNRPDPREVDGMPMQFPPYQYRPYPSCMYGAWTDATRRAALMRAAVTRGLNLSKPDDREMAEAAMPEHDSRLVGSDAERKDWADRGWADDPDGVKAAETRMLERIAQAAAERAYTDTHMTDKAQAEFHAADQANGEDHLLDLPVPRRGPGRPPKFTGAA